MFRQKSLYIIWAITVVMILLNLQMIEQRTFSTLLCESGTLVTMLSPLFTAIFFSADHSSGFIKNYVGSVSDKTVIIAARAVIILIQNLLSCCVVVISGLLLTRSIGDTKIAVVYTMCMLLAGLGCSFAVMLITDLFRKTVPALILTLAIGTGILCELISTITAFATDGDIIIKNYLLTGMFQIFGETQSSSDAVKVVLISVIYIAAALTASVFSIKKRDVI